MSPRASLVTLLALATCRSASRTHVSNGDIEVRRIGDEAATRATALHARAGMRGDWVLRDRELRVTVAGVEGPARDERPGTVSSVTALDDPTRHAVRSVAPVVRAEGRELALTGVRLHALLVDGAPVLRVEARAFVGRQRLDVTRDHSLEPGRRALHVRTRILHAGTARVEGVAWGARIVWGSAAPFAPGLGVVTTPCEGEARWVGAEVPRAAAAWTQASRGRSLALRFEAEMHGAVVNAGHTEALTAPVALRPGQTVEDHAVLLVTPGPLTEAARAVAFVREEPVAEAALTILGSARDPVVTIADAQGRAVLVTHPRERDVVLPLEPGAYVARATAPGHADADPVPFTVSPGSAGAVPVELSIPRGGHLRVAAVDEETQREIPVRVTVRGVRPTRDPNFGPAERAAGAGPVAVAITGRTELPVPPGTYRVTVSHGPEWTLDEHTVTVTETMRGDVSARLRHVLPMAAWAGCDLHVHADPSFDSRVTIEDRVASLVAEGVDFATPTEHNVVGDYAAGVAMIPEASGETLQWVPAVEVTTDRNAQPWGHFNVYPYLPDPSAPAGAPPPFLDTSPRQIFRVARANNPDAIIQVNHPRMQPNIGYFNTTGLDTHTGRAVSPEYDPGFDAVEVFNGFYINRVDQVEAVLRDWMSLLSTGARYVATGSSDSHSVMFQWAGYPRTYVRVQGDDAAEPAQHEPARILRALRQGRAFVTSGPMLFLTVGDAGPGDTVPVGPQEAVRARVRVMAAPWIPVDQVELYRDGERVASLAVRATRELSRLDAEVTVVTSPGAWIVAVARGPRGGLNAALPYSEGVPFAFTNPVFFGARAGATPPRGR